MQKSLLFVLFISSFVPSLAFADRITPSDRVQNFVTVRDSAENGTPISMLVVDEEAELLSTQADTYFILMKNGTRGYVLREWTNLIKEASSLVNAVPESEEIPSQLALHFLDVGQGESTLLICPDNSTVLIDSGSMSSVDPSVINEYIVSVLAPDHQKIDSLIITQAVPAHYNLLPAILSDIPIGHLFHIGSEEEYAESVSMGNFLRNIPEENRSIISDDYYDDESRPNPNIPCGDTDIYLFVANTQTDVNELKDRRIALRIQYDEFSAILMNDATQAAEKLMLDRYSRSFLDVDLLKIGSHSANQAANTQAWVDTLSPLFAVISAGKNNIYGYPGQETLTRLSAHTLDQEGFEHHLSSATFANNNLEWNTQPAALELIYSTADSGNILIVSTGKDVDITTSLEQTDPEE